MDCTNWYDSNIRRYVNSPSLESKGVLPFTRLIFFNLLNKYTQNV